MSKISMPQAEREAVTAEKSGEKREVKKFTQPKSISKGMLSRKWSYEKHDVLRPASNKIEQTTIFWAGQAARPYTQVS